MITGEVGTGKTVAVRAALSALDPTRHTIIYIGNPATGVRGIHHHIVTALGGRPAHGTATLTAQAYDVLAAEAAEGGRTPVLIIDERRTSSTTTSSSRSACSPTTTWTAGPRSPPS